MKRAHRRPRVVLNWLLSIATSVVFGLALVAIECSLRLARPEYLYRLHAEESSNVYSETYGWKLRAGFRGLDFGRMATVNAHGYRGQEHEYQKPRDARRVVVLGDSIAYGAGVDDDQTFSALLEKRPPFEVLNLAVGGYGTDQELIRLEREGLRYQPDVVILSFCLFSDFTDNALSGALFDARQPKPYFSSDDSGALTRHDEHLTLSTPRKVAQWLADYSHLYNRLRGWLGLKHAAREPGVWADRKAAVETNLQAAAELSFRLIRKMNDVAHERGARFLVIVHPDEFAFHHRSKLLRKFCSTPLLDGIPVVELGERYRERGLGWSQVALDTPGHLTVVGHKTTAEALETLLSGPVPEGWDYRAKCREADVSP